MAVEAELAESPQRAERIGRPFGHAVAFGREQGAQLAETDFDALEGQQVAVLGAFTYDDPSHITVTAVSVEVAR